MTDEQNDIVERLRAWPVYRRDSDEAADEIERLRKALAHADLRDARAEIERLRAELEKTRTTWEISACTLMRC